MNRDRDFWDWVADTVAIGMALAPMILVWWRDVVTVRSEEHRHIDLIDRRVELVQRLIARRDIAAARNI